MSLSFSKQVHSIQLPHVAACTVVSFLYPPSPAANASLTHEQTYGHLNTFEMFQMLEDSETNVVQRMVRQGLTRFLG